MERRTTELMAMGLKSGAAVIQRVCPLISDAREAGFSHRAIYEALSAAGLQTTWTNYRIALGRAIKASRTPTRSASSGLQPSSEPRAPGRVAPVRSADLRYATSDMERGAPIEAEHMDAPKRITAGTSTAIHVMDALRQAREVANSKDYGQIARDLYRQQQRDRRRKDRP